MLEKSEWQGYDYFGKKDNESVNVVEKLIGGKGQIDRVTKVSL